ncbi:MAG: molybdenum cofactor guanylyltransferase, partial [Vulcanimicrobiaceae bacterium]
MTPVAQEIGVVIVAGGRATRLPGKLALPVRDGAGVTLPMLALVYRKLRGDEGATRELVVSAAAPLAPELAVLVPANVVLDAVAGRGPLGGLASACARMRSPFVFAAAGDAPRLDESLIAELARAWQPGDE